MKQWFNASGAAASGSSVAASITQAVQSGAAAVRQSVKNAEKKQQEQKEYLRLPVASARRLHWFELRDLSALVRQHTQEKEQLMACVQAMRTCMLQRGIQVRHPTLSTSLTAPCMLRNHAVSLRLRIRYSIPRIAPGCSCLPPLRTPHVQMPQVHTHR